MPYMNRTRIKICGVRDVQTAAVVADAGADAIGLVFAKGSPRQITYTDAKLVTNSLPPFVEPIGLFVDTPVDEIRQVAQEVGLRTVQLHGMESPDQVEQLAPLRIIKAIAFDPSDFAQRVKPWLSVRQHLAGILLDAPQTDGQKPRPSGGSGRQFDWDTLGRLQRTGGLDDSPPLILAGGLNAQNVAQAISSVSPYGVDVSSGVESSRGVKDESLVRAFCNAVSQADARV